MRLIASVVAGFVVLGGYAASAQENASPWSTGKTETAARLVAGTHAGRPLAAVEIKLADGWKTYWRTPGDGGGVPPAFSWAKSINLASATVLYPVPTRFADKAGDTLGYKGQVSFPVEVTPQDVTLPVSLVLAIDYGVCREICVPVEAELRVDIPAGDAGPLPQSVMTSLERVARASGALRPTDPKLTKTEVKLEGPHPSIMVEAEFPGGTTNAAAYVEGPDGSYIPLPKEGAAKIVAPGVLRFVIDMTGAGDLADIRGKPAKVTLVSEQGLSEAMFKLE